MGHTAVFIAKIHSEYELCIDEGDYIHRKKLFDNEDSVPESFVIYDGFVEIGGRIITSIS